ncbi:MAG: cyclic nucleotide-binding domain-containing protein [Pseudomonadota bacterium]
MPDLIAYFSGPVTFVHMATLCYALGLTTRRELRLRLFILAGTCCYILYYYNIAEYPLWEAIAASLLIGAANVPVIFWILRERSTWGMSSDMLELFKLFPTFNPGQFRRMMALGEISEACEHQVLLRHGERPDYIYLTLSEGFMLVRATQYAEIGSGNFLGEISFLLEGEASATVIASPGSRFVRWEVDKLVKLMGRSPNMANAISVLLNKDIARKLSRSFPQMASALPETLI